MHRLWTRLVLLLLIVLELVCGTEPHQDETPSASRKLARYVLVKHPGFKGSQKLGWCTKNNFPLRALTALEVTLESQFPQGGVCGLLLIAADTLILRDMVGNKLVNTDGAPLLYVYLSFGSGWFSGYRDPSNDKLSRFKFKARKAITVTNDLITSDMVEYDSNRPMRFVPKPASTLAQAKSLIFASVKGKYTSIVADIPDITMRPTRKPTRPPTLSPTKPPTSAPTTPPPTTPPPTRAPTTRSPTKRPTRSRANGISPDSGEVNPNSLGLVGSEESYDIGGVRNIKLVLNVGLDRQSFLDRDYVESDLGRWNGGSTSEKRGIFLSMFSALQNLHPEDLNHPWNMQVNGWDRGFGAHLDYWTMAKRNMHAFIYVYDNINENPDVIVTARNSDEFPFDSGNCNGAIGCYAPKTPNNLYILADFYWKRGALITDPLWDDTSGYNIAMTIAHEFGHFLKIPHLDDNWHMMNTGTHSEMYPIWQRPKMDPYWQDLGNYLGKDKRRRLRQDSQ